MTANSRTFFLRSSTRERKCVLKLSKSTVYTRKDWGVFLLGLGFSFFEDRTCYSLIALTRLSLKKSKRFSINCRKKLICMLVFFFWGGFKPMIGVLTRGK